MRSVRRGGNTLAWAEQPIALRLPPGATPKEGATRKPVRIRPRIADREGMRATADETRDAAAHIPTERPHPHNKPKRAERTMRDGRKHRDEGIH